MSHNNYKMHYGATDADIWAMPKNVKLAISVAEKLPHGSGINSLWQITDTTRGDLRCSNTYEAMNECGMYCHNYDFTVLLTVDKSTNQVSVKRVMLHNAREYACCGYDLRSYLEDDIQQCIDM